MKYRTGIAKDGMPYQDEILDKIPKEVWEAERTIHNYAVKNGWKHWQFMSMSRQKFSLTTRTKN